MNYEHRMMRCKLDRSSRIGDHRYRPGEQLREGHKANDDFEEFTPPPAPPAPVTAPVRAARAKPKPGEVVHGLPKAEKGEHGD